MPPKTKSDTDKSVLGQPDSVMKPDFLLAADEGNLDTDILPFSGPLQLPTVEQVLKLYYFIREQLGKKNGRVSQEEIANKVAIMVTKYWDMAGYKTVVQFWIVKRIKKLIEKYQNIMKNKGRTSALEAERRREFSEDIKKLFDIATPDLEDLIEKSRLLGKDDQTNRYRVKEGYTRKSEDLSFLADQRGERRMVMGSKDTSYEMRVVRSQQRSVTSTGLKQLVISNNNEVIEEEDVQSVAKDKDEDYQGNDNKKKKDTIVIELPVDILNSPEVCSMLDRTGTTSRKAVGVVSSVLKTGKVDGKPVDLSEFKLSRPTLERKRIHNRSVALEQEREEFLLKMPRYAAAHWDGKLIQDVTGTPQEHEAILVSGSPHYLEGKLLSVTKLVDEDGQPTSTGEAQALAVLVQLREWGVDKNIMALVFDTTASNSGVHRGATVRLQSALDRPVFFLACRHHVSELIIKACWYSLFEDDLSPDCKFFADIKEQWSSLDTSGNAGFLTLPRRLHGREEAVIFLKEVLSKRNKRNEMAIRDDYAELAECALAVLGETPPRGKIVWKKAGACHKARFMAFGIYSLKAFAFSRQLKLDHDTEKALKQFCSFIAVIYIPHFLASSIGSDASVNDLELFKKLFEYRKFDPQLSDEALVVLRRHCWYLVPEVAIFSLFSKKVSMDEKSRLSCKLLTMQTEAPKTYKLEKPKFPVIDEKTRMEDLLTPKSFKFFSILGIDSDWLAKSPDTWEAEEGFRAANEFVNTVKVTNDVAERGVKLATDYATVLTKDDSVRSLLLQGVDRCRRMYPDFLKSTLSG